MNDDQRLLDLRAKYRQDNSLDYLPAVIGDSVGNVYDPNIPGNIFVRQKTSNGLSAPRSVKPPTNSAISLSPGANVELSYDKRGQLFVSHIDTAQNAATTGNPLTGIQPPPVPPARISQSSLSTLQIVPTQPTANLTVVIKSWNPIVSTTAYQFAGASQDMTASLPSAGNMRYAMLAIENDYATVRIVTSTARSVTDLPLGITDIQECITALSAGDTPVYALKLIGGQTQITQSDIDNDGVDMRQLVNNGAVISGLAGLSVTAPIVNLGTAINPNIGLSTPVALNFGGTHVDLSATGGAHFVAMQESIGANFTVRALTAADLTAAYYQTIRNGGSSLAQEPIVNFIAGTNLSLTIVDNPGNTRTDITINATASGSVTSITAGTGLTGGVITTSGTIALSVPVIVANGGTGQTSLTAHNLIIGNASSAVAFLAPGASQNAVFSNGTDFVSRVIDAGDVQTGTFANARINWAAPGTLGSTTPNTVAATNITITGGGYIKPSADSTASILWENASGSTIGQLDSTNIRYGFGNNPSAPGQLIDLYDGHLRFTQLTAPGAATAALAGLGAGNVNSGTHSYKITFVTSAGETQAGAASNIITTTSGNGQVTLSAIPTGATGTASRNIYRTKAGGSVYFLLTALSDNTTTIYADNIADVSLTTTAPSINSTGGGAYVGAIKSIQIDQSGNVSILSPTTPATNTQVSVLNLGGSATPQITFKPTGAATDWFIGATAINSFAFGLVGGNKWSLGGGVNLTSPIGLMTSAVLNVSVGGSSEVLSLARNNGSSSGNLLGAYFSNVSVSTPLTFIGFNFAITSNAYDANTSSIASGLAVTHSIGSSIGGALTAANNIGVDITFQSADSTSAIGTGDKISRIRNWWTNATNTANTLAMQGALSGYWNSAGTITERDVMQWGVSGLGVALWSVFSVTTPIAQPASTVALGLAMSSLGLRAAGAPSLELLSKYNGDTLAGNGLISNTGTIHLTAQTASIGTTSTGFTPPSNGMYMVSIALYDTTAAGASVATVSATISWTDPNGAQTFTTANLPVSALGNTTNAITFYATTGSAISYATTVTGLILTAQYELDVVVMRLS